MGSGNVPVGEWIKGPAIITLIVTIVRLAGELMGWPSPWFNANAGGDGAIVGISWLIPLFGFFFGVKLAKGGYLPKSLGLTALAVIACIVVNIGAFVLVSFLQLPQAAILIMLAILSWLFIWVVNRLWSEMVRVMRDYAFAARIPVAAVMLIAMIGDWKTHYDVPPPNWPEIDQANVLFKWIMIGAIPQMSIWIAATVLFGGIFAVIAAAIFGKRSA